MTYREIYEHFSKNLDLRSKCQEMNLNFYSTIQTANDYDHNQFSERIVHHEKHSKTSKIEKICSKNNSIDEINSNEICVQSIEYYLQRNEGETSKEPQKAHQYEHDRRIFEEDKRM